MSEDVAVLIKGAWRYVHDWDVIMSTLALYGLPEVMTELNLGWSVRNGVVELAAGDGPELSTIAQKAEEYGLSHFMNITTLSSTGWSPENDHWKAVDSALAPTSWVCATKQAPRVALADLVTELINTYGVKGISLDYIRYSDPSVCFCNDCRAEFETWRGAPVPTWPADAAAGGALHIDFLAWRFTTVTRIVTEVYNLVKSIDPSVIVTAAVYGIPVYSASYDGIDYPEYNKYVIGQDAPAMAQILDYICPMHYLLEEPAWWDTEKGGYRDKFSIMLERDFDYIALGDASKLKWWITTASPETGWVYQPVDYFLEQASMCLGRTATEYGAHGSGVRIWRYYGPGFEETGTTPPDIRPYLEALALTTPVHQLTVESNPSGIPFYIKRV